MMEEALKKLAELNSTKINKFTAIISDLELKALDKLIDKSSNFSIDFIQHKFKGYFCAVNLGDTVRFVFCFEKYNDTNLVLFSKAAHDLDYKARFRDDAQNLNVDVMFEKNVKVILED